MSDDKDDKNVVELKTVDKRDKTDKEAMQEILDNWEDMLEQVAFVARTKKATYDAFIEAGFTEEQAIQMCKSSF